MSRAFALQQHPTRYRGCSGEFESRSVANEETARTESTPRAKRGPRRSTSAPMDAFTYGDAMSNWRGQKPTAASTHVRPTVMPPGRDTHARLSGKTRDTTCQLHLMDADKVGRLNLEWQDGRECFHNNGMHSEAASQVNRFGSVVRAAPVIPPVHRFLRNRRSPALHTASKQSPTPVDQRLTNSTLQDPTPEKATLKTNARPGQCRGRNAGPTLESHTRCAPSIQCRSADLSWVLM